MKYVITSILIIFLITLSVYFYNSKMLVFNLEENKNITVNAEIYNTDLIKKIKNGTLLTKKKKINTEKVGEQTIKFTVKDFFNREKNYKAKIKIVDNEAPTIKFKKELTTEVGKKINLLKDVEVTDNTTEKIEVLVIGEHDFNKVGTYNLKYLTKDSSGNETKEDFVLYVKEKKKFENNETTFTTSKGFQGVVKNGITYIDNILIVNKTFALPKNYGPGLTNDTKNAFDEMQAAAKLETLNIYLSSGYRSYSTQQTLYNRYVKRDGVSKADTYSARPGHSEHQSGLAFDVNQVNDSFHDTEEAQWLANNCYKYGLILRYPKGKTNETGYKYESWHFRYVGKELAEKLYNNGDWITLENYFGITSEYQ